MCYSTPHATAYHPTRQQLFIFILRNVSNIQYCAKVLCQSLSGLSEGFVAAVSPNVNANLLLSIFT